MRAILTVMAAVALATSSPALATGNSTRARIAHAFTRLGMKADRSDCYGRIITTRLRPALSKKAATILESSESGSEVRKKVKKVGGRVLGAFMSAKANCGT